MTEGQLRLLEAIGGRKPQLEPPDLPPRVCDYCWAKPGEPHFFLCPHDPPVRVIQERLF